MRLPAVRLAALSVVLLSGLVVRAAQPKHAPAKVDEALRARVSEFHKYQMEGNFRKAYDLVAKESRDFFFSTAKEKPAIFKIEEIEYADKFKKAVVRVSTTNRQLVGFHVIDLPTMIREEWRLDGGKWVWYHDPKSDQPNFFGLPVGRPSAEESALAQAVPKDTSPQALASAGQSALQGSATRPPLDKDSIEFVLGTPGTEEVVVRNPYRGEIRVVGSATGDFVGVTVEPEESVVPALGEVRIKVRYTPLLRTPDATTVVFELRPFNRALALNVSIIPPADPAPGDLPPAEPIKH